MTKAAVVKNPNEKTYAVLILDESGSMGSCKQAAMNGFNEQVQAIRSTAGGQQVFLSVVKFNSNVTSPGDWWNQPPALIQELTNETYQPNGTTAMLDAVGGTLSRLKAESNADDENNSYLVVIVSDGEENASREWNYGSVGELIQTLQATGRWTFTYMGSNQDLGVIQRQLHIPASNTALYKSDAAGSAAGLAFAAESTKKYMRARTVGVKSLETFYNHEAGAAADLTDADAVNAAVEKMKAVGGDADATAAG